ncbi:GBS Bsp-like repeat-containing protein, partial [Enterococcus rivorum]
MKKSVTLAAIISLIYINTLDIVAYAVEGENLDSSSPSSEVIENPQKRTLDTYLKGAANIENQTGSSETGNTGTNDTTKVASEEDFEDVFYDGEWIRLPKQLNGERDGSGEGITEENQNTLGRNFKDTAEGRAPRGVTTIHAGDTTRPSRDFVDISSYQPNISVSQFEVMKKYGVTGVVVKLTEGTSYRNPYAKQQVTNAKAAGLKVSTYHFSWFTNKAQAEAEADYYANFAKELGLGPDTVMVNDAETPVMNNGYATTNSIYFALRLLNTHKFSSVIHYSSLFWFTSGILDAKILHEGSIWVAQYLYNPLGTDLRHSQTSAWQWSDGVYFPEIPGLEFDMNIDYKGYFAKVQEPGVPISGTTTIEDVDGKGMNYKAIFTPSEGAENVKKVEFPTWGNINGQNDLIWYNATKQSDGTWTASIDVANHKEVGQYFVHTYATNNIGIRTAVANNGFIVQNPTISGAKSVTSTDNGTFRVTITVNSAIPVDGVKVPIWSKPDQSDIVWYKAKRQADGTWVADFNQSNHKNNTGVYIVHAYADLSNKTSISINLGTVTVTNPVLSGTTTIEDVDGKGMNYKAIFTPSEGAKNVKKVEFPTWGNINGQNDLIWYNATKQSDGTWTASIDVANH